MRIPKTFYDKQYQISFNVKDGQIFYHINKWSEDGTNLSLLKTGKYNNENPKDLITLEIKSCDK